MSATLENAPVKPMPKRSDGEPIRLRTHEDVEIYLARHLKPVRRSPKGQPIYALKDIEALNVIFPDDLEHA